MLLAWRSVVMKGKVEFCVFVVLSAALTGSIGGRAILDCNPSAPDFLLCHSPSLLTCAAFFTRGCFCWRAALQQSDDKIALIAQSASKM